jgi:hypothetical protein
MFVSIASPAQTINNPIPERIPKRGLAVEIRDIGRLPDSRASRNSNEESPAGWARINYVRDLPDGRRFVNDSRGFLYLIDAKNQPHVYADLSAAFPYTAYSGLESGFIGFVFHPEFARNGLFYTVHTELGSDNPKTPDFIPPLYALKDVTYHSVVTEWHATNPAANVFEGTRRDLLRVAHVVQDLSDPIGALEFNPAAKAGDEDYGLLYIGGSDYGLKNPAQTQRLDSIVTAILRIDPRSPSVTHGQKGLGDYTIPMANRLASDADTNRLGEIYAYGFRNAHRLSWNPTDGTMFASDIGLDNIEEINVVHKGANYGWMKREGLWDNGGGMLNQLFQLPDAILDGSQKDGLTYPVAMYDHDEGRAVTAAFAYSGSIPQLRGKLVFGDIQNGRLFASDLAEIKKADDGIPKTVAAIEEIQLYVRRNDGKRVYVSLQELIDKTMKAKLQRADLQISKSRGGELIITSRQDGMIRMLVP